MNNLKFYRARSGKTMTELANEVGTTRQAICVFEGELRHRPIPAKHINALCKSLDCTKFQLLGDESFAVKPQNDADREDLIMILFNSIQDKEVKERIIDYVQKN